MQPLTNFRDFKEQEEVTTDFDLRSYDRFFQQESESFLHLSDPRIKVLNQQIDEGDKWKFIHTTYSLIVYLIKEYLYTTFIREYGM